MFFNTSIIYLGYILFSSFITIVFFFGAFFFGMRTDSCKSKSPCTYENWCFNLPLSTSPSILPPFCALGKVENEFFILATTL
jgi:hypothetical protein